MFQKALDNFKKELTAQQCRDFGITKLQDVKNEINKIQSQYGSAKKLRGMSRMSKFLEAMHQLEQVVSVFLNVSEAVAFIWVSAAAAASVCKAVERKSLTFALRKGPIKFFLVVSDMLSSFPPIITELGLITKPRCCFAGGFVKDGDTGVSLGYVHRYLRGHS